MTLQTATGDYAWRIDRRDGIVYEFDSEGNLRRMSEPNGNAILYAYNSNGQLTAVSGPASRGADLTYASGRLSAMKDSAGRVYSYGYDGRGYLSTVTDPLRQTVSYLYDANGRLERITDAADRSVQLGYDGEGRLSDYASDGIGSAIHFAYQEDQGLYKTTVTDALNRSSVFTTNQTGNLLSLQDAKGNVTQHGYDSRQRMVKVTDARGLVTLLTYEAETPRVNQVTLLADEAVVTTYGDYSPFDQPGLITDAMGNQTRLEYDAAGNLLAQTEADGTDLAATARYTYQANGMPQSVTDAEGNTTRYEVDDLGQIITVTNPLDGRTSFTYDAAGNLHSSTDSHSGVTTYEYDSLGRISKTVYPDGTLATAAYDPSGLLVEQVAPGGNRTEYQYDAGGRLIGQTDNAGAATRFAYDEVGNQMLTFLPNGTVARREYNELGRLVRSYDGENLDANGIPVAGAHFTEYGYDAVGNPTFQRLPSGHTLSAEYDLLNRVTRVTEPPDSKSYTYDKLGRNLTVQDGNGNWTRYQYDARGRLTRVYDAANLDSHGDPVASAKYTSYAYDRLGRRTRVTDPMAYNTTFVYNPLGLLTQETDPLGQVTYYNYDSAGRLLSKLDRNGYLTAYDYDIMNRVLDIRYQDDCSGTQYTYDAAGRKLSATCSCGTAVYQYDADGRMVEEATPTGTARYQYDAVGLVTAVELAEGSITYQYDRANRLQQVKDLSGGVTYLHYGSGGELFQIDYSDGSKETFTTDPTTNRLTAHGYFQPDGTADTTFAYKYDVVGNITAVQENGAPYRDYQYDALSRLSYAYTYYNDSLVQDSYQGFTYDANGNRTKAEKGYFALSGTVHTLSPKSSVTYKYSSGRLLLSSTDTSTSTATVTQYTYDGEGQLLVASSPNRTEQYSYNSRGLLTKEQVATGSTTTFTYNTYDADGRRISRRVTSGNTEIATESTRYQYDGLNVIATRDGANTLRMAYARTPEGRLLTWFKPAQYSQAGWYVLDHLGSVLEVRGGSSGGNSYEYDAFGQVTASSGSGSSDFQFSGAPVDSSGMVYLSARFYNPSIGRFLTQDTWKGDPWQPWTQNLYVYVGNNPVNYTDPTGHCPWCLVVFVPGVGEAFLTAAAWVGTTAVGAYAGYEIGTWFSKRTKTKDKNQNSTHESPDEAIQHAKDQVGDLGEDKITLTDQDGNVIGEKSADGTKEWRIDDGHVNWKVSEDGVTTGGHAEWTNGESVPNATTATGQYEWDSNGNIYEVGDPLGGRGR